MKTCSVCTTENPINAHTCQACGSALDQFALDEQVQKATIEAKKKSLHKKEIYILLGLAVVGIIAYEVFTGKPSVDKVAAEAFYRSFIQIDGDEYQNFWKCIQRGIGKSARTMKDNLELYRALEGAYNRAPAAYPGHIKERCIPKAKNFPAKMKEVKLVDALQPETDNYIKSADMVAAAAEEFANKLQEVNDFGKLDAKVIEAGNAFHFDADDSDMTVAFDNYLRCAIPDYDAKTEMQEIVVYLAGLLKDGEKRAVEVARWRKECAPALEVVEGSKRHPNYKENVKKLGVDDRDLTAFQDLFRKADERTRGELMEIMGKAWMEYFNSWQGLKKRLGEALGS